jgi:hypothetical protein
VQKVEKLKSKVVDVLGDKTLLIKTTMEGKIGLNRI